MDPSPRIQALRKELAGRYRLQDSEHVLGGQRFTVTAVEDLDDLLDDLIAADPDSEDVRDERLPYYASLWPTALVLAGYILQSDDIRPDMHVLELGCGLGLCSAAACCKNARVTATDYQPDALLFTRLNCLQNAGREPETARVDWREPPGGRAFDLLIGSDLAYEARFFDPLIDCFDRLVAPGGQVLFAEPNRALARPFFLRLAQRGWACEQRPAAPEASVYGLYRSA